MLITTLQVHGRWVSGAEVDQPFSLSLIESKTAQFGDNELTRESHSFLIHQRLFFERSAGKHHPGVTISFTITKFEQNRVYSCVIFGEL